VQPDSNTQIIADGIQQERSATIGSREVVSLGTPISDRLFSTFPVGAQHACPPWRAVPGLRLCRCLCSGALQGGLLFLLPDARLRRLAPFVTSLRTRPEPIRSAHSISISNRNIPRLEPHLTVAISTDNSFLIATKHTNRTFVFFLDTEARQRHLKSASHYAYLSRHTFKRQSAIHERRERAADVFGLKPRNSNRRKTGT
jgi:hypothetical protein